MAEKTVTTSSSGGVGLGGLLTVAFIVLKLTGYINWPWLWVLAPAWIPLAAVLAFLLIFFVIVVVAK